MRKAISSSKPGSRHRSKPCRATFGRPARRASSPTTQASTTSWRSIPAPAIRFGSARGKSQDLRKLLPADLIENILPKLREAATYNDKLVAVPQYWNTEMYFYRKDLFGDAKNQADFKAKYGYDLAPPTTWDQLADIDEFFHRPPDLYGGWMSGVNWGIGLDYQTILFGVGGRAFDLKANTLLANSPESVKTFEIMQRIAKTAPESFATQSFFDADTLMLGGKLASYTNYSYIWADARQGARQVRHDGAARQRHPDRHILLRRSGDGAERRLRSEVHRPGCCRTTTRRSRSAETGNPPATISQMSNPAVTSLIPEFEQFVAAAEKLTPVEVTWGPEFFEGVSIAGADVYAGKKTPQEAADWLQNTKFKDRKPIE